MSESAAKTGWQDFDNVKPVDGKRYHYTIGNQFFKGRWSDDLKGFILDGCNDEILYITCDQFHIINLPSNTIDQ